MALDDPARKLRFLTDPPLPGDKNMSIDRSHLEQAEISDDSMTVIRFYRWDKPTVSLGANQMASRSVDPGFCSWAGIAIISRPTGGRAVLHDNELTYSVISNDPEIFPVQDLLPVYRAIADCLMVGLKRIGIQAVQSQRQVRTADAASYDWTKPCFSSPSRHELLSRGRKLVGSAQRRLRSSFLQHGSLPLEIDYETMGRALRTDPGMLRAGMISVSEAAGRKVTFEELAGALEFSFRERLSSKASLCG